jgi:arylsulfatase A-like enzyme
MVFDGRWKYVHATGFRPMLYDLATDPQEFRDLGDDPEFAEVRARMKDRLFDWALRDHARVTMPDDRIAAYRGGEGAVRQGVLIGFWDEAELRRVKEAQ